MTTTGYSSVRVAPNVELRFNEAWHRVCLATRRDEDEEFLDTDALRRLGRWALWYADCIDGQRAEET